MSNQAIGIFGGTFDPIHFGHLRLAQELATGLKLGEVRFIPTGRPPHRNPPAVSSAQRLEMVRLAIAGNPLFALDTREIFKEQLCYTVDTLSELRSELGNDRPLCLLMGSDAFFGLTTWHRWQELFGLAHIIVAHRPGFPRIAWADSLPDLLKQELRQRLKDSAEGVHEAPSGLVIAQPITALAISATFVRNGLQSGVSPRYLLPDAVLEYIQANRLYAWERNGT